MTGIGLALIVAMAGLIGFAAIRLVPVYLTQMQVQRILNGVKDSHDSQGASPVEIRRAVSKGLDLNDVKHPAIRDFIIRQSDAGLTVGVAYEEVVPFIGNISLLVNFDNQVEINR